MKNLHLTSEAIVIDPVCKMKIKDTLSSPSTNYANTTYYFCSSRCKEKFQNDPLSFLNNSSKVSNQRQDTVYTCPMHPDIVKIGPGACPICGMDLEPKGVSSEDVPLEDNTISKRFWISLPPTLIIFAITMSEMLPGGGIKSFFSSEILRGTQFLLATPVVFYGGSIFFQKAWRSIWSLRLNMFTLIAIGTSVAYFYSVVAILFPEVFPKTLTKHDGKVDIYFEAASMITALVLLGQKLEAIARKKTGSAIRELLSLSPQIAHVISSSETDRDILINEITVGMLLRVKPGEGVPVDGIIHEGSSSLDESMITGEAIPINKIKGDKVIGGTINQTGSFILEVQRVGEDTLLSQIVRMVSEAQRSRAPIERIVDLVSGWFVPLVLLSSICTFSAWLIWGPEPRLSYAIVTAVSVLIIACPCALGLATPLSIMVATGRGAKEGIIIRDAEAIEVLEKIDILLVDKTGTLTEGKPTVSTIKPIAEFTQSELLRFAASIENSSEHPLARAVLERAKQDDLEMLIVNNFLSITGKGVKGEIEGKSVALGNSKLLSDLGIVLPELLSEVEDLRQNGETVIFVIIDNALAGFIGIADKIKSTTHDGIKILQDAGVEVQMLTGDNETTANAVAKKLGIEKVFAGVSPEEKIEIVKQLQSQNKKVAMAGDGINDGPALSQAEIGIAMGTGTEVAIKSAGITLIQGDLRDIAKAQNLSRATMRNIRQNLVFAFGYNALGIPVAAGILFPWSGLLLNPMIAALAMSLSSLSVVGNALRLRQSSI